MDEISKRKIAASAERLRERRENGHVVRENTDDFSGDDLAFLDGPIAKEFSAIEQYVGFDEWPADEPLPEWMAQFSDIVEYSCDLDDPRSAADDLDCQPFVDIFGPVVEYSHHQFLDDTDVARLSADAMDDFENYLVERLVEVGAQALHVDFLTYISEHDPDVIEDGRRSSNSTEWYDSYVAEFFDGRIVEFFEYVPVLARLFTLIVRQWAEMVSQFASRLDEDYWSLCSLFGVEDLGRVSQVKAGAGDTHAHGQTVVIVTFETGDEAVYKPREIEPEKQFYEFESWLNRKSETVPALQTLDVLDRSTYGWVEKLDRTPFSSLDAVADYYRRTGAFLCVLYLLHASDCHYENVVAGDISPVLVDAETVPNTPQVDDPEPAFESLAQQQVYRSNLLETMAIPFEIGDKEVDHSGVGMIDSTPGKSHTVSWLHVNTDAMDIEYEPKTRGPGENFPTYAGDPVPPEEFVDEIVDGFGIAYDAVSADTEAVKQRLNEQFDGVPIRNVLRETTMYGALLDTLTNPQYLKNGVEHECKTENTLARRFSSIPVETDAVLDAERRAILRRDVPRFTMQSDGKVVRFDGKPVFTAEAAETGLETIRDRVDSLSTADKKSQQRLIRACLDDAAPTAGEHRCGDL